MAKKSDKTIYVDGIKFKMIGYVIKESEPKHLVIRTSVRGQLNNWSYSYGESFYIEIDKNLKFKVKWHSNSIGTIETWVFIIEEIYDNL